MKYIKALVVICLLLTFIWFRQGNILGGGDAGLAFYSPSTAFNLSRAIWVEYGTGGSTIGWLPTAGVLYFYSLWEKIGVPTVILQASLFFMLMSVGVLSVYYLCNFFLNEKNQQSKLISSVAAVFYLFNPYTMSQVFARGQLTQQTAFGLLPFVLLLAVLGIKRKSFLFAVFIAISSAVFSTAFSFLTFVIVFWLVLAAYFLFAILTDKNKLNTAIFVSIFFSLAFLLWVIVNAWWFIPLFISSGSIYSANISGLNENLGTLLGVSRNFTPGVLIRLLQRTYFFDPSAFSTVYSSFPFQLISLLAPIFLLIGLIKVIRSSNLGFRFFAVLLILGLTVSLGANPPFGFLFVWIFKIFTPLQAFRNPFEKFGLVLILGYSPIFAYGLVSFFAGKRYKNLAITTVLLLICGIFAWPMWTGRVIAGPDKKIGLSAPSYYKDLNKWLSENNGDERVLMTPLWSGDGAFYQWGEGKYQGSDPMIYLLDQPTISNTMQAPYYFEYISGVRKYMDRMNLAAALALLRTKYLVNREDAVMLTEREKEHSRLLTGVIYPLQDTEKEKICQDQYANSSANGTAWVVCPLTGDKSNLSQARYLIINIKTDVPALLDISVRDRKKTAVRWDGRVAEEYRTPDGNFTKIVVPLSAPTEYNNNIDFADVEQIDILARQAGPDHFSVGEITLKSISVDPGREKKINTFDQVKAFGNLKVFKPRKFVSPPEFGLLDSLELVKDIPQLFKLADNYSDLLDKKGFVLTSQNPEKSLAVLPKEAEAVISGKQKINSTRYWIKLAGNKESLVLLSKTFNTQWKLIPGVTRQELAGNLFADMALLRRKPVTEEKHFVVNGYANLWKVDGQEQEYAIIYKPQIIADIGARISKYSLFFLLGILILAFAKRYVKQN